MHHPYLRSIFYCVNLLYVCIIHFFVNAYFLLMLISLFYCYLTYTCLLLYHFGIQPILDWQHSFINECDITPFAQYFHLIFQPLISSDVLDKNYNPFSQADTNIKIFTCRYFHLNNKYLAKNSTSTGPNSCLTFASLNIRNIPKNFEMFQVDISKLNLETLLPPEIEMVNPVPSFNLFTNNRTTLGGGVLLYVKDTLNTNKLVIFFCNAWISRNCICVILSW